jgi:hypothetical protein
MSHTAVIINKKVVLVDVEPVKLVSTWRNNRVGGDVVSKRHDIFLVSKLILVNEEWVRLGVEFGGDSYHLPNLFQIDKEARKRSTPFKFNSP